MMSLGVWNHDGHTSFVRFGLSDTTAYPHAARLSITRLSERAVDRMVASGEWAGLLPGVYALRGCPATFMRQAVAAYKWAGSGALMSHATSARNDVARSRQSAHDRNTEVADPKVKSVSRARQLIFLVKTWPGEYPFRRLPSKGGCECGRNLPWHSSRYCRRQ